MIKYYIEQSWLLIISAFVFGLLLAVTNSAWSGRIEQNKKDKLNSLMSSLISDASFSPVLTGIPIDSSRGRIVKVTVYRATDSSGKTKGFCFNAQGPGFADKIELVIAADASFKKILGFNVLSSNETPGFGDRIGKEYFNSQFRGVPVGPLILEKSGDPKKIDDQIVAISGATVSSTAVVNIFNHFVQQIQKKVRSEGLLSDVK